MQKNTKKANRITRCEQFGVRTGIKSGISDCCKAYLAYAKQNGNTFVTESDCPPDDVCYYVPVPLS